MYLNMVILCFHICYFYINYSKQASLMSLTEEQM